MDDSSANDDSEHLSVDHMLQWLSAQVHEVSKMCQLRLKDATKLATEYAAGKITEEEMRKKLLDYGVRWEITEMPTIGFKDAQRRRASRRD